MTKINLKPKLIVITGPTASGKTELALELNRHLNSIIISADSRQVYKELSIGTAKPSLTEIQNGNIKLTNHISIHENYTAGIFESEALDLIENEIAEGKTPILCGGTGLYIKAVCEGLDQFPTVESKVKKDLELELEAEGLTRLLKELEMCDPEYFRLVDQNNSRRVIRALSVFRQSGNPFSSYVQKGKAERTFEPLSFAIDLDRGLLYERINTRVDKMFDEGLLREAEGLHHLAHLKALDTVGYKECFAYLDGDIKFERCKELIKQNSRRYAKRQMTWIRNQMECNYILNTSLETILAHIKD